MFIIMNNQSIFNSENYQDFLDSNQGKGNLKIRAYAASEALPVKGLHIIVTTVIDNKNVVFFDGKTDTSGMIETLSLPTPKLDTDNLSVPLTITYNILAISSDSNEKREFQVNMYDGICVVQNINFVPGGYYGN